MTKVIKIKKGLDVPLTGASTTDLTGQLLPCTLYGICPDDFPGYKWRLLVAEGDKVEVGTPLLGDKSELGIRIASPVAGTVKEVHRGERRKIEFISIETSPAGEQTGIRALGAKPSADSAETVKQTLLDSGLWAMMRQRPFDIVPSPASEIRDIFVTAFDSAPLAPEIASPAHRQWLEAGLKALKLLTPGKIYLSTRFGAGITSDVAEVYEFSGPHPAGNVGVQIANIKPVNKGETVLALDAALVATIGKLFAEGELNFRTTVAITGPAVKNPSLVKTVAGASLAQLLKGTKTDSERHIAVISGNILTGIKESREDGFLRYPYRQVTLIESGDDREEMFGWASLDPGKFSVKRSFPAFLKGKRGTYDFDTRLRGGHRSFILSGDLDKVLPMDIYSEYLLKAIMARDIDKMEQLGIYEVAPEDFALPEFVDTSKMPLQEIVRDGLDYLRSEL